MATTMADLAEELVVEILFRVPITSLKSVRCTCKKWNVLSKNRIFGKVGAVKNQYLGFMVTDSRVCSLRFDLQGIRNDGDDSFDLSIKQVSVLNQFEVYKTYHCDGLLLCVLKDNSRLLIWNPYLGQMKWIQFVNDKFDKFALGYDSKRNHKILKIREGRNRVCRYDVYEFRSNSWRALDHVTPNWKILSHQRGVSLKGNTYFYAQEKIVTEGGVTKMEDFLLCFDYTSERFGPRLSLPFHSSYGTVNLSCVRDDQLAVLHQQRDPCEIMEIWITSKIGYNEVLWTKFLKVDMQWLAPIDAYSGTFFIDVEKKVVVVFDLDRYEPTAICRYQTAHIIGQEYYNSITIREVQNPGQHEALGYTKLPLLCSSSYVPSLVQIV